MNTKFTYLLHKNNTAADLQYSYYKICGQLLTITVSKINLSFSISVEPTCWECQNSHTWSHWSSASKYNTHTHIFIQWRLSLPQSLNQDWLSKV